MATDYSKDFNFITDRLAIGCLASRATPGFVAVVSVVTVEGRHRGRPWSADLDFYLDDATAFIADHIAKGCVLVHCGAGISRSAAVVIAYLCRYAGMSYAKALTFVKAKRPQVAPADVFKEAIERWLGPNKLATSGLRQ